MADPQVQALLPAVEQDAVNLVPLPATEMGPGAVAGLVVGGLAVAGAAIWAIHHYCIVGPHPEPGTSRPAHC
jgi:Mg/Co/Ni transporter MgtE